MTDTLIARLRQIDIGERDCADAADLIEALQGAADRLKELERDALRYRWLRENCDWTKGGMVFTHIDNVRLGSMCPSLELLDECVDRKLSEAALTKAVEISQELGLP